MSQRRINLNMILTSYDAEIISDVSHCLLLPDRRKYLRAIEGGQPLWPVIFDDEFDDEFEAYSPDVQDHILAKAGLLARFGPQLGRPHADHLKASAHPNMKELRLKSGNQVWRVAYAFDPQRRAIILVAGDKQGKDEKRFYKDLIATADKRFAKYRA